ncbi:MAG: c-type cytochrome [Gammaproteobacteria bacterium]
MDKENLQKGKALYEENCLSCHGSSGNGADPAERI